jgi:hypothetical protein
VNDVRIRLTRPRLDERPRRSTIDHKALVAAKDRAWLDATRYRTTL